jgi:hypothetical protein
MLTARTSSLPREALEARLAEYESAGGSREIKRLPGRLERLRTDWRPDPLAVKVCDAIFHGKVDQLGEGKVSRRTPLPAVVPTMPPVIVAIIIVMPAIMAVISRIIIVMSGIPMLKSVIMAIPVVPPAISRPNAIRIIICRIRIVERDAIAETDTEAAPAVCRLSRGNDKQNGGKSRNYDQILDFIHFRSLLLLLVMSSILQLRPYC